MTNTFVSTGVLPNGDFYVVSESLAFLDSDKKSTKNGCCWCQFKSSRSDYYFDKFAITTAYNDSMDQRAYIIWVFACANAYVNSIWNKWQRIITTAYDFSTHTIRLDDTTFHTELENAAGNSITDSASFESRMIVTNGVSIFL